MSVLVRRNTGWQGSASKIQIQINGEKIDSVGDNQEVNVRLPDGKAQLNVTQFGVKSNEIEIEDGDIIDITVTRWHRMSFPIQVIAMFFLIISPNFEYKTSLIFFIGILYIISLVFLEGFSLDKENNQK